MAPGALTGCCKGIDRCARYPVSFDLSAEEVKTEPTSIHFVPRKLGNRPPTRELVALFVPLTTAVAVAVDTQRGGGGSNDHGVFHMGMSMALRGRDGVRLSPPCREGRS